MPSKFDTNQWIRNWSDKKEMTPLPERSNPRRGKKKRFIDYMSEVASMARDARTGNVGAQMVRGLYNEGKTEEAQKLANDLLRANVAGISLATGAASTKPIIDLAVGTAGTALETVADGDVDNLAANIGINTAFDLAGYGAGKVLNRIIESDIVKKAFKEGRLRFGLPTIFDRAYHQSDKPVTEFVFPYKRWDVINHGADPKAAFFTLDNPATGGFLSERPFINHFTVFAQRPLHQIGEITGTTKNGVRNRIVKEARKRGADAVVFEGIADNQLKNQNILMAFDTSDIKHARTSTKDWSKLTDDQWDLLYNKAISDGNLEEAQRLRDLHFVIKTPNNAFVSNGSPVVNFHGSPNDFNEFSLGMFGQTDLGDHGVGFYFSPSENYAKFYGKTRPFYLYAQTPYTGKRSRFLNRGKNYTVQHLIDKNRIAMDRETERSIKHMLDQQRTNTPSIMYDELDITENTPEHIIRERVKSLYDKRHKEYIESLGNLDDADSYMSQSENVLWNDKHIKLADPITYDDSGNIIPLSKRDDFTNSNIRYAIAPLIGLSVLGKTNQAE